MDPNWADMGFMAALGRYGYNITPPLEAVVAFQRHHRPARFGGVIDAETRTILRRLLLAEGL